MTYSKSLFTSSPLFFETTPQINIDKIPSFCQKHTWKYLRWLYIMEFGLIRRQMSWRITSCMTISDIRFATHSWVLLQRLNTCWTVEDYIKSSVKKLHDIRADPCRLDSSIDGNCGIYYSIHLQELTTRMPIYWSRIFEIDSLVEPLSDWSALNIYNRYRAAHQDRKKLYLAESW